MNFNTNATVYNRRKAFMNKPCSGYLSMGIHASRESLDDDDGSDTASIQSTTSTLSYRTWKKLQKKKQRAKLERAHSLFGDAEHYTTERTSTLDPFTFDPKRPRTIPTQISAERKRFSFRNSQSSSVDYEMERGELDELQFEKEHFNELSTIIQSPVEPYYSSSDLDTSSDDENNSHDVIKSLPSSDEHKETREWLMSGSFSTEKDKQEFNKVIQRHIILAKPITKPVSTEDLGTKISLGGGGGGGGGLNDLTSIISPQSPSFPSLNETVESKEEIRTTDHSKFLNDVHRSVDMSIISHEQNETIGSNANEVNSPLLSSDSISTSLIASSTPMDVVLPDNTVSGNGSTTEDKTGVPHLSPEQTDQDTTGKEKDINGTGSNSRSCENSLTNDDQEGKTSSDVGTDGSKDNVEETGNGCFQGQNPPEAAKFGETEAPHTNSSPEKDVVSQGVVINACKQQVTEKPESNDMSNGSKSDDRAHAPCDHEQKSPLLSGEATKGEDATLQPQTASESADASPHSVVSSDVATVVHEPPTSSASLRQRTLPMTTTDKESLCCCCHVM